jgi:hypothetical protein
MTDTLRSLCEELTEFASLLDDPPNELVARAQAFLEKKGCWLDDGAVDIESLPDACVIDEGKPHNCVYAQALLREGKGKLDCKYWNVGEPLC